MKNTKWLLGVQSPVLSASWDAYAQRYGTLLRATAERLPGEVTWWDDIEGTDIPLDPNNMERLLEILINNQLRNDAGELMARAGSHQWLTGRYVSAAGESRLLLSGGWGGDEIPVHAALDVFEPGEQLWSYSDETMTQLIGGMMAAIDGDQARVRDRFLHRLLVKADAPFEVGSHVYMRVPLDDPGRFPPGARQVRCGEGWLLIMPPGVTDEETLARMRWVASAIGTG